MTLANDARFNALASRVAELEAELQAAVEVQETVNALIVPLLLISSFGVGVPASEDMKLALAKMERREGTRKIVNASVIDVLSAVDPDGKLNPFLEAMGLDTSGPGMRELDQAMNPPKGST